MRRAGSVHRQLVGAALAAAPLACSLAEAAERHEGHVPSVFDLVFPVINFSIFAYIFYRYAWPAIRNGLADRRKRVEQELAGAAAAEREAEALLREIRARKARLGKDAERLVAELRAEGERERQALLEAARKSAERLRSDARLVGEHEAARVTKRIREEIAARVTDRVAAALRERFDERAQERLVREFLAGVGTGAGS